ncbi:MAG: DUF485 domain-containing protein [Gammaproteobacteria bacterium]
MHYENIHQLLEDERFRKVIRKKQRLPLLFSLAAIFLFFGFVLVIAFAPGLLAVEFGEDGVIKLYLILSVLLIILICVLMNLFVTLKARDNHDDIHELIGILREENER